MCAPSVMERAREKERVRVMRQQEKVMQQEAVRVEREMRAQQILEVIFAPALPLELLLCTYLL